MTSTQVTVTAFLILSAMCEGQIPPPGRFYITDNGPLLTDPVIVKDLKLSTEQIDRLRVTFVRLTTEYRKLDDESNEPFPDFGPAGAGAQEYIKKLTNQDPEERARQKEKSDRLMKKRVELQQEETEAVKSILELPQWVRLAQIRLQRGCPFLALKRKEIAAQLSLTDEQRTRLSEEEKKLYPERYSPPGSIQKEREAQFKQFAKMRAKDRMQAEEEYDAAQKGRYNRLRPIAWTNAMAILSDEQKEKWSEIIGPKIDSTP